MPKPIKPPRGVFISTQVLFHPSMKAQVRDTLIQLLALAWGSQSRHTPPLSYPQLAALTGKTIGRLYGHITILRKDYTALRLQSAGDGQMIISFADWVLPKQQDPPGRFKNSKVPYEEEDVNPDLDSKLSLKIHPLNDHDSISPEILKTDVPKVPQPQPLTDDMRKALLDAGVFPSLLPEIGRSARRETDLYALLAWAKTDRPQAPAALFMGRLRAGAVAPDVYYQPPCPVCGVHGGHREDCRRRYHDPRYAAFIEGGES